MQAKHCADNPDANPNKYLFYLGNLCSLSLFRTLIARIKQIMLVLSVIQCLMQAKHCTDISDACPNKYLFNLGNLCSSSLFRTLIARIKQIKIGHTNIRNIRVICVRFKF